VVIIDSITNSTSSASATRSESRHVLSTNSATNESIYALTVGCCGEPPPATGDIQYS